MVKQIAKTGCNVLLVQKSILRDAVTDLSLDFCAKAWRLERSRTRRRGKAYMPVNVNKKLWKITIFNW